MIQYFRVKDTVLEDHEDEWWVEKTGYDQTELDDIEQGIRDSMKPTQSLHSHDCRHEDESGRCEEVEI